MANFPKQSQCDNFYGNPRGVNGKVNPKWEAENITYVQPPWKITYDNKPYKYGFKVHKKTVAAWSRAFARIWDLVGQSQAKIDEIGLSIYSGGYEYRNKRTSSKSLSMHAYGAAIDFDQANNQQGDTTPKLANYPAVMKCFELEGFTLGLRWKGKFCDGMHVQAASN